MGSIVDSAAAQWGAIGMMMLGCGWLIRYLVGQLAARDKTIAEMTASLMAAYKENTAAWTTFSEVLRERR